MQGINFIVFISAVEVEFSLAKLDFEEQAYLLLNEADGKVHVHKC